MNGNNLDQNEREELLQDHVETERGQHYDEPAQSTTTIVHGRQEVQAEQAVAPLEPATTAQPEVVSPAGNTPGLLVLQWLTYAFWGWTAIALSWLGVVSVNYFVNGTSDYESSGSMVAYALAATIVLFIIALGCDIFYSKKEPLHKKGMASVIMVIHAVIFALFGIGWVISAVFGIVRLFVGPESIYDTNDASSTYIIVGLVMGVVYVASLTRTLRMKLQRLLPYIYWGIMVITTIVFVVMGIAGPVIYAKSTKNDRMIEANLGNVSRAINGYTSANGKLPGSLQDIRSKLNESGKTIVDNKLVEYKPGKEIDSNSTLPIGGDEPANTTPKNYLLRPQTTTKKRFQYTLCVTYKSAKDGYDRYQRYAQDDAASYRPTEPDAYMHGAGRTCYDLQTSGSYDLSPMY